MARHLVPHQHHHPQSSLAKGETFISRTVMNFMILWPNFKSDAEETQQTMMMMTTRRVIKIELEDMVIDYYYYDGLSLLHEILGRFMTPINRSIA